jgi:RHS repeat-associated protein
MGNVTTRTWSGTNGRSLSYVFDELGRLTRVTELAGTATNSVWVAQYDALGRRYRTTSTPYVGGVAGTTAVTESWFDPEVKFLEVAVTTQGQRWWNVHGPDLSGTYGSEHGMGGLEGSIREADGVNEGLVPDNFGHGVGTISSGSVTWNATVETGYGPAMGYEAARLGGNVSPMKAVSWRGQRMESFGLYVFGSGRPYNPLNGRFESPDPMGHDAATSLYDYADGDPVNGVDADGLVAKGIMEGLHTDNSTPANSSIGFDLGYSYGSLLNGIAEGFRGGSQITANTLTFGGSDALNWTHSTDYQGWEYTGTRGLSTIGREALIGAATLGSFQMARGGSEAALFTYQGLQIANTARSGFAFGTGVNQVANGDNWGYANIVGGALGLAGGFGMAAAAPELNGGIQTMRRGVAESFYESAGYSSDRIASHLEGIDFSKSVRVTTINQGKQMIQWQKPGTPVGRYFAEVGTTADQLGVSAAGRVNTLYTASRNTPALRSTAADTSSNMKIPPEFRGGGGGTQFFVPDKGVFAPSSP